MKEKYQAFEHYLVDDIGLAELSHRYIEEGKEPKEFIDIIISCERWFKFF